MGDVMDAWRRANVDLISSIGGEYLDQVQDLVRTATTEGIRAEALSKALQERLGVAESRAELIARDQVLKANAQLSAERMRRVGVTKYKWSTSRDSRSVQGMRRWRGDRPVRPASDRRPEDGRRGARGDDFSAGASASRSGTTRTSSPRPRTHQKLPVFHMRRAGSTPRHRRLGTVERTPQGGIRVPAFLSRTGIQEYAREDGSIQREWRPEEESSRPPRFSRRSTRRSPTSTKAWSTRRTIAGSRSTTSRARPSPFVTATSSPRRW